MDSKNKEHRKDDFIESVIEGVDGLGDDLLDIELPYSLSSSDDLVENEIMSIDDSLTGDSTSTDDLLSGILADSNELDDGLDTVIQDSDSIDDLLTSDSLDDVGGDLSQLLGGDTSDTTKKSGDSHGFSDDFTLLDDLGEIDAILDDTLLDDLDEIDAVLDDTLLDDLDEIDAVLDDTLLDDLDEIDAVLDDTLLDDLGEIDAVLDDTLLDDLGEIDAVLDDTLLDDLGEIDAVLEDTLLDDLGEIDAVLEDTLLDDLGEIDAILDDTENNSLLDSSASIDEEYSQTIDDLLEDDSLDAGDDINHLFEQDLSDDEIPSESPDVLSGDDGLPGFLEESPEFVEDIDDVIRSSGEIHFEEVDDEMDLLNSFGNDEVTTSKEKSQNIPHQEIDEVENLLDVISLEIINDKTQKELEQKSRVEDHNVIDPYAVNSDRQAPKVAPVEQPKRQEGKVENSPLPESSDKPKSKSMMKKALSTLLIIATLGSVAFGVWFGINQGYIDISANGGSSAQMVEFSSELAAVKRSNKSLFQKYEGLSNQLVSASSENLLLKQSNDKLMAGLTEHKNELTSLTRSVDDYRKDFESKLERSMNATLEFMGSVNDNTDKMGEKVYSQTMARVREEFADDSGVKLDEVYEKLVAYDSKISTLEREVKGNKTLMSIYEDENAFVKRRLTEVSNKSSTRTQNKSSIVAPKKKLVKGIPSKDDDFCCIYITGMGESKLTANKTAAAPKPEYLILGVFDQSSNQKNPHWSIYLEDTSERSNQNDVEYSVGDVLVGYGRILNVVSIKRGDGGIPYEIVTELGVIRNR
jgi:hypothetical protein